MSTGTLYELAGIREQLDTILAENEGELSPELEAALDQIAGDFNDKAERVALYIRERHALAKAIKEEEDRLMARRAALTNNAARLTAYLQAQMERVGSEKVNGLLCTIALVNNPASVRELVPASEEDLRNVAMMAPTFVRRVPESFAWDRKAILDAYKAGTLPADVSKRVTVVQTRGVRIR